MKRLGNIWEQIVTLDNLNFALQRAARGKRSRRNVRYVLAHSDRYIQRLYNMLTSGTFHTSKYQTKYIYEPKKRLIYILPFFPDRIVQHAFMNVLEPYWDKLFIYDSYSCRVGKGQHKGSIRCMELVRKYDFVLKCDVSKFYPSINHAILKSILRRKLKDERVLAFLDDLIDSVNDCHITPVGVNIPIGNLVSQWFGNLYLNEFDTWLKHEKHIRPYIRYCDDFVIFSNDKCELHQLAGETQQFMAERLHLRLSKCNVFPSHHGVDFLGYRHFGDYILLRKSIVKRLKRKMRKIDIANFPEDEHTRSVVDSYYGWLTWANSYRLRKSLGLEDLVARRYGEYAAVS